MSSSFLSHIAKAVEEEANEAKRLRHEKFKENWLGLMLSQPHKFEKEISTIDYDTDQHAVVCPEPLTFIQQFDDISDNQQLATEIFLEMIKGFHNISLDHNPDDHIWFNSTINGVNLRPGLLNNEKSNPIAVAMGDYAVHGVVVGRTGSGKSVFLNNLIFNMLAEYPPWELDIYLADFKKVELSRYMTKYRTPHLKACAGTSEIRYVVSLITYIVECMYARQNLFARLGLQKLSDFRKKFGLVLPRTVLLVDEFQQLFLEATTREGAIIQDLLMSIVKLGRATGFHLLFASQEMSGVLSGKALANFKIRFALPCDAEVSTAILGNSAAADLEIGNVYVNTASGRAEDNQLFRVPFISDEAGFYSYLQDMCQQAEDYDFAKNKKFYQEDSRKDIQELTGILEKITDKRWEFIDGNNGRYFDVLTLGEAVVYKDRKIDLETFFVERGRNKNICVVSPEVDDIAYMQKLLAVNFKASPTELYLEHGYNHVYFSFNAIVSNKYDISMDLENVNIIDNADNLADIEFLFNQRKMLVQSMIIAGSPREFVNEYFSRLGKLTGKNVDAAVKEALAHFFEAELHDIPDICKSLVGIDAGYEALTEPMMYYYEFKASHTDIHKLFAPYVIWMSGIDSLDALPRGFANTMKNGMDVNMLFVIFSTSDDNHFRSLLSCCDYIFAGGNNQKIYERCGISFTNKARNSIVIDFIIKSLNTERSFKKYKFKLSESIVPSLNFDQLLGDE